jgi:hypothetical protein
VWLSNYFSFTVGEGCVDKQLLQCCCVDKQLLQCYCGISNCFSVTEGEGKGSSLVSKGWFENLKKWMIVYVMKGRHTSTWRRQVYRVTCLYIYIYIYIKITACFSSTEWKDVSLCTLQITWNEAHRVVLISNIQDCDLYTKLLALVWTELRWQLVVHIAVAPPSSCSPAAGVLSFVELFFYPHL